MEVMEHSDGDIIKQCLKGNKELFAVLVDKYKKQIVAYIFSLIKDREEANDLAQETFIRVYKNLWKYNQQYKFSTWIYQIAKNISLDYLKKKRPLLVSEDYIDAVEDKQGSPEQSTLKKEMQQDLLKAVNQLAPQLRETLILYHINNLSYQEISEIRGITVSKVKNQLFQARKKMKKMMAEGGVK